MCILYRRPINHLQCVRPTYMYVCTSICQGVRAIYIYTVRRRYIVSDHFAYPAKDIYNIISIYIHFIKPRTTCAKRIQKKKKKLLINIPEASQVIYFRGVQKNDFIKTFNLFTFIYSFCIRRGAAAPFPSHIHEISMLGAFFVYVWRG